MGHADMNDATGFVDASKEAHARLAHMQTVLDGFVNRGEVDGAAVAVAWRGQQIAEFTSGFAAPQHPARFDTLWPLASISKVYTATAVMRLVERGLLSLAQPVRSVLPEFTGDGREQITLRHLLTHTSGIVYESPEMVARLEAQQPIDAMIDEAYTYPLLFTPGTRLSYSDYNYALAGRMAAITLGVDFPSLIEQEVLVPGGLHDTFMPPPRTQYERLAHVIGTAAYGTPGSMYNADYALQLAHPAFGTVSTVSDLLQFGLRFTRHDTTRLLSGASVRVMTTDQTGGHTPGASFTDGTDLPRPWAIGFSLKGTTGSGPDLFSPSSFGHGGASGCMLMVDPEQELAVAFVSNKHALTGREAFSRRQQAVCNVAAAALT